MRSISWAFFLFLTKTLYRKGVSGIHWLVLTTDNCYIDKREERTVALYPPFGLYIPFWAAYRHWQHIVFFSTRLGASIAEAT